MAALLNAIVAEMIPHARALAIAVGLLAGWLVVAIIRRIEP